MAGFPGFPTLPEPRMKGVKKQHLPEKNCAACGRPFAWRKKWERDWEQVRFCSEACRRNKHAEARRTDPT
jgi:hypothetical protein